MREVIMDAVYKSSILLFIFNRMIWGSLILFLSAIIIASYNEGSYLLMSIFTAQLLIGMTLFIRTVRIIVYPDHIKIVGMLIRRRLAYSSLKWAAQVPMLAPKTIFVRLRLPLPIGFYLYPVTSHVFFDDLFNMDIHYSVEYINERINASE